VPEGVEVVNCDVRNGDAYATALTGREFDVVVNWVAFTPEHIQADLDVLSGKTAQYVFISSATVYQKPPAHYLVTEDTPRGNPFSEYARNKIACEDKLMEAHAATGFPATIVRPSYTYGDTKIPNDIAITDYTIVQRMKQGKPVVVHGDGQSLWTLTHNTDFARGFVGLLGRAEAIGEAYHITSDEVLTWDQIFGAVGAAAGVEPRLVHVPSERIVAMAPEKEAGLYGDKMYSMVLDNRKVKALVPEFEASMPFAEGVRRSVAWFEAEPERMRVDSEADALLDRLIDSLS
jgi:nucleoside-diphosphate-sugar epimerase